MIKSISVKLQEVAKAFRIEGTYLSYEDIKIGNVNQTYKITYLQSTRQYPEGRPKSFIVQRVNTYAFRKPDQLMQNIDEVTEHIRARNPNKVAVHYHHLGNRSNYYTDPDGVWRLCNYIDSVTHNEVSSPEVLRSAGEAFGDFQVSLSDFEVQRLYETIPDFHNTRKRLEALFKDAEKDIEGRACEVAQELEYIRSVANKACTLIDLQSKNELPIRVTHNDTKINNVLFDKKTDKPLVIIDLDTVMPGLVGYDFGDAVRFACNTVAEDSKEDNKASIDLTLFRAFTEGFLSKVKSSLTEREIETLALSVFTITIELASRFLDDYLNGDKYFNTSYSGHNLVRARCQLGFAKDVEKKLDVMDAIIKECVGIVAH